MNWPYLLTVATRAGIAEASFWTMDLGEVFRTARVRAEAARDAALARYRYGAWLLANYANLNGGKKNRKGRTTGAYQPGDFLPSDLGGTSQANSKSAKTAQMIAGLSAIAEASEGDTPVGAPVTGDLATGGSQAARATPDPKAIEAEMRARAKARIARTSTT